MYFLINLSKEIPVSCYELPEYFRHCFQSVSCNSSPKWILLIIYFYDIFGVFSPLYGVSKYIDIKHYHQTRLNNEVIDCYKI